jgi:hypothetical protein
VHISLEELRLSKPANVRRLATALGIDHKGLSDEALVDTVFYLLKAARQQGQGTGGWAR